MGGRGYMVSSYILLKAKNLHTLFPTSIICVNDKICYAHNNYDSTRYSMFPLWQHCWFDIYIKAYIREIPKVIPCISKARACVLKTAPWFLFAQEIKRRELCVVRTERTGNGRSGKRLSLGGRYKGVFSNCVSWMNICVFDYKVCFMNTDNEC